MNSSMSSRSGSGAEAICAACGGVCCREAHPPLSGERVRALLDAGVARDAIEFAGYLRLGCREDGMCVLFSGGKCQAHAVKPETCLAGPFTFDVSGHTIRIFLKRESICPLAACLRRDPAWYESQYRTAAERLTRLVRLLPRGELAAIAAIPEPETDLVAEIPLGD